jgi:hypothetical protein
MTLKELDKHRLYVAGFTNREIEEIANATDPSGKPQPQIDLDSDAWKATIAHRRQTVAKLRADFKRTHGRELDRMTYDRIIDQWYQRGLKRNPFDWLVEAYAKGKKAKTDFVIARKNRFARVKNELKQSFDIVTPKQRYLRQSERQAREALERWEKRWHKS